MSYVLAVCGWKLGSKWVKVQFIRMHFGVTFLPVQLLAYQQIFLQFPLVQEFEGFTCNIM